MVIKQWELRELMSVMACYAMFSVYILIFFYLEKSAFCFGLVNHALSAAIRTLIKVELCEECELLCVISAAGCPSMDII